MRSDHTSERSDSKTLTNWNSSDQTRERDAWQSHVKWQCGEEGPHSREHLQVNS